MGSNDFILLRTDATGLESVFENHLPGFETSSPDALEQLSIERAAMPHAEFADEEIDKDVAEAESEAG